MPLTLLHPKLDGGGGYTELYRYTIRFIDTYMEMLYRQCRDNEWIYVHISKSDICRFNFLGQTVRKPLSQLKNIVL